MTQKFPKGLLWQPLRYTEAINERDEAGTKRAAVEHAITVQLSERFWEYSFVEHARAVLDCIQNHFPRLPEESTQTTPERDEIVLALLDCLYRWHDSVADQIHPSEAEATSVSRELVLLGLFRLFPHLIEVVPPPVLKGTLRRYIATPMLVTLIICTEDSQDVTLALDDDLLMSIIRHHELVSYTHFDNATQKVLETEADKITCDIEDGHITSLIIEKDGIITEK